MDSFYALECRKEAMDMSIRMAELGEKAQITVERAREIEIYLKGDPRE